MSYSLDGDSSFAMLNGARVAPRLKSKNADGAMALSAMIYFYASVKESGPYLLRIEALGEPGEHEYMGVRALSWRFAGEREFRVPEDYLFDFLPFKETLHDGKTLAVYTCPLQIDMPKKVSNSRSKNEAGLPEYLLIKTTLNVNRKASTQTQALNFKLNLEDARKTEFVSVPKELWRVFGGGKKEGSKKTDTR